MDKMIKHFLETEIQYQDWYDGIIDFIASYNIRNGEYECNEYVIKKMDHTNFIIFLEYSFPEDKTPRKLTSTTSIYRNDLIKIIDEFSKKQGFKLRDNS